MRITSTFITLLLAGFVLAQAPIPVLKDKNFVSKIEKNGGLDFFYDIETKLGVRNFKLGVESNGFIETYFFPK